ncbi:MAG: hypothetical protein ACREV5_15815 [Steroidobacter sp.]
MRRFRTLTPTVLLLFAAACTSTPPEEPAKPASAGVTGAWLLTVDSPMGTRENEAVFTQQGEQLTGVIKGSRGETPLTGALQGDAITFGINVTIQGQNMNINYSGAVAGDTMSGNVVFGDFGDGKWSGKRKEL